LNAHFKKENYRVLVVNDDRTQLLRISRILEKQNLEVLRFSNGAEVVAYLDRRERADLIVTDLHMPEVDGWKLCRLVRSREYGPYNDTPVLATSAVFCGEEAQSLTAGLGANALLRAPFTSAELIRCVKDLLTGEIPSIRTRLLLIPFPGKKFRGLANCFRRFGYEVLEESDAELALKHLEVWKPAVVIIDHDHQGRVLDKVLRRERQEASFNANLVVLDEGWQGSQVDLLRRGADACVRCNAEPDYVVSLTEKMSRVRALFRLQDLVEYQKEELRSQKESFRGIFEAIPDAAIIYDQRGQIKAVNDATTTLLGASAASLVGRRVADFIVADDLEETFGNGWSEGLFSVYQASLVACTGRASEVNIHQSPINYGLETCTVAVVKGLDMPAETYEAISSHEDNTFSMRGENAHDWEFWRSPQGHFLYSSPICKKITGYDPFEFEMDVDFLHRIAHPEDVQLVPQPDEEMSDDFLEAEFRIIDRSGGVRWLAYKSRPVYDDSGNYLGCRGAMRDLTLHKQLEGEKERLVAAVEQFSDSIAITDLEGHLEYVNPAFERNFGEGKESPLGSVYDMIFEEPIQNAIAQGAVWSGRRTRKVSEEEIKYVELTVSPVRDHDGVMSNLVWSERDVTAEVAMQERLMRAQRMEAIGTLAGGVAHDFNNLLSGILGYSSLLKGEVSTWQEIQQAADVIERAARRAADLTQKLLGFARQGKHKHEAFSIHESVAEVLTLLTRTTDPRIIIEGVLDAENPWIIGDSGQVGQVLLNLAINSTHAIDQNGRLTIYTRNLRRDQITEPMLQNQAYEEYLEIRVEDTGCGIPEAQLQRIFEPFFTTKEKGSGLGLAMVYGIVQNHDGWIHVDSAVGEGTTFILYFPVSEFEGKKEQEAAPTILSGKGKILVIDDEEIVRNIAANMLRRIGYEVITVEDGQEAVEYYAANYKYIDLVIVDMMMPRMDGRECFRALRSINPDVKAILSTGYSHNQTVQEIMDEGLLGFIGKPFELQEIASAVEKLIGKLEREEEDDAC